MPKTNTSQYEFEVGGVRIAEMQTDTRKGQVTISINTAQETIQVYVTRTGAVRILSLDEEWFKNGTPKHIR